MRLALPIIGARSSVDAEPLLIAAFCVLWSSAFAVSKIALADCPPFFLLTMRFIVAGGIMLAGAAMLGSNRRLGWRDGTVLAAIGIANNALYLGFNYYGMLTVPAGLTALIGSTNPVLTALLAAGFLGEPMTVRKVIGLVLGVAGVALVVESRISSGSASMSGIWLILAALVSLVGGTILFKRFALKANLVVANGVQTLAGGLALAPFALAFESIGDVVPTWRLLAALSYLTIGGSIVAYLLWLRLLNVLGATAASAYHFLMPPLGMLFGWILLGEHLQARDLIGILPVAAGIWLVTRPAAPRGRRGDPRTVRGTAAMIGRAMTLNGRSSQRFASSSNRCGDAYNESEKQGPSDPPEPCAADAGHR
jgi:drug/metabolite transporter (DMT)-like permease